MEHYIFNCGQCKASYSYVGYKTGIGKTPDQLKQMDDDRHICRKCGYDDRADEEGPKSEHKMDLGDNASTHAAQFTAGIIRDLIKDKPEERVKIKWHCGMYVGPPKWQGTESYEPDECCADGTAEVCADAWENNVASVACTSCGARLEQADSHFELLKEGEVVQLHPVSPAALSDDWLADVGRRIEAKEPILGEDMERLYKVASRAKRDTTALPSTREEIGAEVKRLNEERERLRKAENYNSKQLEAVQALCDHPETYHRDIMGRDQTNICRVCGKHDVLARPKE